MSDTQGLTAQSIEEWQNANREHPTYAGATVRALAAAEKGRDAWERAADNLAEKLTEVEKERDSLKATAEMHQGLRADTLRGNLNLQAQVAMLRAAAGAYFEASIATPRDVRDALVSALASTAEAATRHDAEVRRAALKEGVEALYEEFKLLPEGGEQDGMNIAANVLRALATEPRTKETK